MPPLPHHWPYVSPIWQFTWVKLRVEVAPFFLSVRRAVMAAKDRKPFYSGQSRRSEPASAAPQRRSSPLRAST